MSAHEAEPLGLPFLLYDYDHWNVAGEVNRLIEDGILPPDTFFRLASVGQKVDYENGDEYSKSLNFNLMLDMVSHIDDPDKMRNDTKEVLWGELPDAIVDVNSGHNYPAYAQLDPMYYRKKDLIDAIHRRRVDTGQALPDAPFDRRLHNNFQDELSRCKGIARSLWGLMVRRFHPEWLETPEDYFPRRYIGTHAVVYEIGPKTMKRGIVSHAVLRDPLVLSIYEEAVTTGVRGIGEVGIEDLRILLSDEHPELHEGHEIPDAT